MGHEHQQSLTELKLLKTSKTGTKPAFIYLAFNSERDLNNTTKEQRNASVSETDRLTTSTWTSNTLRVKLCPSCFRRSWM